MSEEARLEGVVRDFNERTLKANAELGEKVVELLAKVAALEAENKRLQKLLDRDHTGLASGINAMRQVFRSYGWIPAGEWGSYEWQERTEKHFREEVGRAFDEAERIGEVALRESGIRANAAFYPERDELAAERTLREQAQADAAALRGPLQQFVSFIHECMPYSEAPHTSLQGQAKAALATNAGQALLDELAALRAELEIVKHDRDCALKGEEELESELTAERTAREQAQADAAAMRAEVDRLRAENERLALLNAQWNQDSGECWQCHCSRRGLQHTNGPCRCSPEWKEKLRSANYRAWLNDYTDNPHEAN